MVNERGEHCFEMWVRYEGTLCMSILKNSWVLENEREGGGRGIGWRYTPLYEKGIKKTQNESMETTLNVVVYFVNF